MDHLKIAIIDDEIHAIRHLNKLIASVSKDYEVAAIYTNPVQALEELPGAEPDLIFVDIMMPTMDGLVFSRAYLKKAPYTKIIILTSYRDFEFAKTSVEIGVCDYWLKNELRASTIGEKLAAAALAVRAGKSVEESLSGQKVLQTLRQETGFSELLPSACSENRYAILYLLENGYQQDLKSFRHSLRSFLKEQGVGVSHFAEALRVKVCICRISSNSQIGLERAAKSLWQALCRHLEGCPGPCVVMNRPFREREYDSRQYELCLEALRNLHLEPGERIRQISWDSLSLLTNDSLLYEHLETAYFQEFSHAADLCDSKAAIALLNQLWNDRYLKAGNSAALRYCLERMHTLSQKLGGTREDDAMYTRFLEQYSTIGQHKLQQETTASFARIFSPWTSEMQVQSQKAVAIVRYIQKNYTQDLNLKSIAEEFGLSSDYLRKFFKSETGISIVDYITQLRIKKSQELLKTGRYKIYEIADMVGYHSSAYFSQAFYKHTGYYPTESAAEKEQP